MPSAQHHSTAPAKPASLAALKRQRTRQLARLGARVFYLRRRGREQEMYDLVCNEFVQLGGVYVKFLQGVLLSSPIMKRWHSPTKLRIFENLDTESMDIVQILRDELTPEQLQNIALVQPEPFAAGSFGQVYLGQHANGKRIIIKVLRPMIRELLRYDLRLLSVFSKRFAAKEYTNVTVKMDDAIKEFRDATLSETDYLSEAQFANDLYEAYKNHPHMVIPETYLGLCTPHLIVQDYLEGVSGVELLRAKEQGWDPRDYVRQKLGSDLDFQLRVLGVENLMGAFELPRVQGDPHPGNLRFLPGNQVGMIDFGISAAAPRNRPAFFGIIAEWSNLFETTGTVSQLFEQFMRFFVNDLYRALKKLSTLLPQNPVTDAAHAQVSNMRKNGGSDLLKHVGKIVQGLFDGAMGTGDLQTVLNDGQMLQAFSEIVNKDNRLGLVVRLESSEILRASQTYLSFLEALGRRKVLLPQILAEVVQRVKRDHSDIVGKGEQLPSMSQAIGIANSWLERIAVRDPALFRQIFSHMNVREAAALRNQAATGVQPAPEDLAASQAANSDTAIDPSANPSHNEPTKEPTDA